MSVLAPRQNFLYSMALLDGLCNLAVTAVSVSPNSFQAAELSLLQSFVDGFKYLPNTSDVGYTDFQSQTINNVNALFIQITKSTPEDTFMALLMKCYETVNKNAQANASVAATMPTILVDIVTVYTSLLQPLPFSEYIQFLADLWTYVVGIPSSDKTITAPDSSGPHPISNIDWISNSNYGFIVAVILKKYFNFDGRFSHGGAAYNVDRLSLVAAYEAGTTVIANDNQRAGLFLLMSTFKRPDWVPTDGEYANMQVAGKNFISQLNFSATQHTIQLNGTHISNFMPFRDAFDFCDQKGNKLATWHEGDNFNFQGTVYQIQMAGTPFYPTQSITLGSADSAKVTNINEVLLTGIVKDNDPQPSIPFTPQPIY
jgi:hypothetical protein